ncbi:glycosyltransferase [Candidatus Bathyarchaeota archaeon]|nr:glycosyltransferase [Candidatus Bathyarchaeota archaeon]
MRILQVHSSLNACGGAEKVALYSIKAFLERGHEIVLDVKEKTDWERVNRIMGVNLEGKIKERVQPKEIKFRRFMLYQNLYHSSRRSLNLLREVEFDVKFHTSGGNLFLLPEITYVHDLQANLRDINSKYRKSLFWRFYSEPYHLLKSPLNAILNRGYIIVNSTFTANFLRNYLSKSLVIYPPVEVEDLAPTLSNDRREASVLSIGRLSPEKNWHFLPLIASKMRDINFYLLASRQREQDEYRQKLLELKERFKTDNLTIIVDPPYRYKLKMLGRCKVLLHLCPYEPFGLAVAEGMASGLIPVVHRTGGQWIDILNYGNYGFSYKQITMDEISKNIRRALKAWCYNEALRVAKSANRFSAKRFTNKITSIIENCKSKVSKIGF